MQYYNSKLKTKLKFSFLFHFIEILLRCIKDMYCFKISIVNACKIFHVNKVGDAESQKGKDKLRVFFLGGEGGLVS